MESWLDELQRELAEVNIDEWEPYVEPDIDGGPVYVRGQLTEEQKRLYSLSQSYQKSGKLAEIERDFARNKKTEMGANEKAEKDSRHGKIIETIFVDSVDRTFSPGNRQWCVSKGWKVIYQEPSEDSANVRDGAVNTGQYL